MTESQTVILCEGYDDRAFLAQWLESLGMTPTKGRPDPWDLPVKGGQYGYWRRDGFVRIVPCDGKANIARHAITFVRQHATRPIDRMILCHDLDRDAPAAVGEGARDVLTSVEAQAETVGGIEFPIDVLVWGCTDAPGLQGVPDLQTLERLVVATLAAAHPDRAAAVQRWLDDAPATVEPIHKAAAYSYLAKWQASSGGDYFYRDVWLNEDHRPGLRARLEATGAWDILRTIVVDQA